MNRAIVCAFIALLVCPLASRAAIITALSSFGGGDGWLAPGEGGYTFLGTGSLERGLAYGNNHLYLVSRNTGSNVRILDPLTGAEVGSLITTGISGGTNPVNQAGVAADGSIYVSNLTVALNSTTPFKVYKWANEAATPTVALSDSTSLSGARLGDDLALLDTGSTILLAAGYNSTPSISGNNSYAIADLTTATSTRVLFGTPAPAAGDFRLGITFTDATHVLGSATTGVYKATSFSGNTGTFQGTATTGGGGAGERLLAATFIAGTPILAMQSTTDAHVSIYDITNPLTPVFLGAANNTSGTLSANANGVGELAWGPVTGNSATLYAMSTNQGIQAFTVTIPPVPEPIALLPLAAGLLMMRRAKRD